MNNLKRNSVYHFANYMSRQIRGKQETMLNFTQNQQNYSIKEIPFFSCNVTKILVLLARVFMFS